MLRTYVRAATGSLINFDRALLLMDAELVDATFVAMMDLPRGAALPDDAQHGAQWIWDDYCERHRQKHGQGFEPDVTPEWGDPVTEAAPGQPADRAAQGVEPLATMLGRDVMTNVMAASGSIFDFDCVSPLMDRALLDAAIVAVKQERPNDAGAARWVWAGYCKRHRERYGTPFGLDIVPRWDGVKTYFPNPSDPGGVPRTYVQARSGTMIDFDLALLLMDSDLIDSTTAALADASDPPRPSDSSHAAQWIWDDYCARHEEKYGVSFGPDVDPDWRNRERTPKWPPAHLLPRPEGAVTPIEPIARRLGVDEPVFAMAESGSWVEFDHASVLMNRELRDTAIETLKQDCPNERDAQLVWESYCKRHRERYGTPFGPDIVPGWDNRYQNPRIPAWLRPFASGYIEFSESVLRRIRARPPRLLKIVEIKRDLDR